MSRLGESAFGLSADELKQIQYMDIVKRRKDKKCKTKKQQQPSFKFTDKLSVEAQIAMQLVQEDTKNLRVLAAAEPKLAPVKEHPEGYNGYSGSTASGSVGESNSSSKRVSSSSSRASFTELYERHRSARMHRDITDSDYDVKKDPKRALGGGKVESAMELVEIVKWDDDDDSMDPHVRAKLDEDAILELARTNAVDKCMIWIEANNPMEIN